MADGRLKTWLRRLRIAAVAIFVCWHLLFLFLSNTKLHDKLDLDPLQKYERLTSLDQAWGMFSSPLYRTLPFPAVRVTFTDGSSELITSVNEPADLTRFVRIGKARLRKLEHAFITDRANLDGDYRQPIQKRLAQSYLQRWRAMHPSDPRKPVKLTLIRRDYDIPEPGQSWPAQPVAQERELTSFAVEDLR